MSGVPSGIAVVEQAVTVMSLCRPGIVQGRKVEPDMILVVTELIMRGVRRSLRELGEGHGTVRTGERKCCSMQ